MTENTVFKLLMAQTTLGEVVRDMGDKVEVAYNIGEDEPLYQCYLKTQFIGQCLPKVGTKLKATVIVESAPDEVDHMIPDEIMQVARDG